MKELSLILPILFFILNANAMEDEEGYYININGDTVYATFIVYYYQETPQFADMTWQIGYRDENGDKKFLSPKEASEVFFVGRGDKEIRLISILNIWGVRSPPGLSGKKFFASVKIEGKLKLLNLYTRGGIMGNGNSQYLSLFWLKDDIVHSISGKKRNENDLEFLSDCPQLVELIKTKNKRVKTFEKITIEYNSLCGENQTQSKSN